MACRQHVSRSIGQEGRGQRGSGFRQTGAQGILQVVDNQVCVFWIPCSDGRYRGLAHGQQRPAAVCGHFPCASLAKLSALPVEGETVGTAAEGEAGGGKRYR